MLKYYLNLRYQRVRNYTFGKYIFRTFLHFDAIDNGIFPNKSIQSDA